MGEKGRPATRGSSGRRWNADPFSEKDRMSTNTADTKESIDERTRKAAVESMTVVPLGSGEYKVYSGTRKSYVVDLIRETCDCPDEEYNHPADGCKHRQRAEMEIGERAIPSLNQRTDVEVMTGRSASPEVATDGGRGKCVECGGYLPDEIEPGTGVYCPQCGAGQHITDGGVITDDENQGSSDENGRPDDCDCIGEMADDDLGCWPCYHDGFNTANPDAENVIEAEAEALVEEMEAEVRR